MVYKGHAFRTSEVLHMTAWTPIYTISSPTRSYLLTILSSMAIATNESVWDTSNIWTLGTLSFFLALTLRVFVTLITQHTRDVSTPSIWVGTRMWNVLRTIGGLIPTSTTPTHCVGVFSHLWSFALSQNRARGRGNMTPFTSTGIVDMSCVTKTLLIFPIAD